MTFLRSAQEPRILSAYSKDERMLQAFAENKDIYATVGSGIFKNNYWDNMEHHEDGSPNVEGKTRRGRCKKLILGMSYGMGAKKMSDEMGCSLEEGKKIIADFGKSFPKVQEWIENTEKDAMKVGYVEDYAGRRRHLPDLLLPEYEIIDNNIKNEFNPLLYAREVKINDSKLVSKYKVKMENCHSLKEKNQVKSEAANENIEIHDNGGFISRAKRQCVNARIQGGAATMTKKAMIAIDRDKEINDLGFKLLIGVHDELIGECPKENAEQVAIRLSYLMRTCVPELPVAFKCDAEIEEHWYENEYTHMIQNESEKWLRSGILEEEVIEKLCNKHTECTLEQIKSYIENS